MTYILNIETSTTVCSVSISKNEELLFCKELNEGFTHAENLHLFIQEALSSCVLKANELNAIAVSKGPGSYTGLRIGVSTAKGLAYALGIPLISVDTLQVMALSAQVKQKENAFYCAMIDARRMEVYSAIYDVNLNQVSPTEALILDEVPCSKFDQHAKIYFFGDGMNKCKELLSRNSNSNFMEGIIPSAKYMPGLSFKKFENQQFENVAYFEPFYLKDFMVAQKKNNLMND
jgi:tRNA threonylcarbamoyladenosine biosynthesis protein TsaB